MNNLYETKGGSTWLVGLGPPVERHRVVGLWADNSERPLNSNRIATAIVQISSTKKKTAVVQLPSVFRPTQNEFFCRRPALFFFKNLRALGVRSHMAAVISLNAAAAMRCNYAKPLAVGVRWGTWTGCSLPARCTCMLQVQAEPNGPVPRAQRTGPLLSA